MNQAQNSSFEINPNHSLMDDQNFCIQEFPPNSPFNNFRNTNPLMGDQNQIIYDQALSSSPPSEFDFCQNDALNINPLMGHQNAMNYYQALSSSQSEIAFRLNQLNAGENMYKK